MYLMLAIVMLTMMVSTLLTMISLNLAKKTFNDREKTSPFECGFDPKTSARLPFSLHFFLIAMIFLIFDVEITMMLPLMMMMKISKLSTLITLMIVFVILLLIGLYHEWNQGALNWTI